MILDSTHIFSDNEMQYILNPTASEQMKSLCSFIKQSIELRTGGAWGHMLYLMFWFIFILMLI